MEKNNNANNEEFNFMQEKVRSRTRRRLRKAAEVVGFSILAAIVFGLTARVCFVASGDLVGKLLGIEAPEPSPVQIVQDNPRREVTLQTSPSKVVTVPAPTPTEMPVSPTPVPTEGVEPTPTQVVEEVAPEDSSQVILIDSDEGDQEDKAEQTSIEIYIAAMKELRQLTEEVSQSLVTIRSITSEVNWMDEKIEKSAETTGVLLGHNNVEILALTSYNKVVDSDRIEVVLPSGLAVEAKLYTKDLDLNLAIIGIDLEQFTDEEADSIKYIVFGSSGSLFEGAPVVALGRPNGHQGSVLYCFVTAMGIKEYIPDGVTCLFTTDMNYTEDAEGIIVNYNGELVGFITHTVGQSEENSICSAIGIDCIETALNKLVNGAKIPSLGLRLEDIPEEAFEELGLSNGIYVSDVYMGKAGYVAGIRKGDVITAINDIPVVDVMMYQKLLMECEPRDKLKIELFRGSLRDEPRLEAYAFVGYK